MQNWTKHASIRRAASMPLILLMTVLALGLASSCATNVPPTITMYPTAPLDKSQSIYLIAARQRDAILKSLNGAGLKTSDKPGAGAYSLQVLVGSSRGSRDCGTVNNVTYILSSSGARIMVIKGRGETGSCSPSIFDEMSTTLASHASN